MENSSDSNVLNEVNLSFAEQSKACNKNCRNSVCVILLTTWGLLIQNDGIGFLSKVILFGTVMLCTVYFIIETWRYYTASRFTLTLLKEYLTKPDIEGDEDDIAAKMLTISEWTHNVLKVQIVICLSLVILLGVFVLNSYM